MCAGAYLRNVCSIILIDILGKATRFTIRCRSCITDILNKTACTAGKNGGVSYGESASGSNNPQKNVGIANETSSPVIGLR